MGRIRLRLGENEIEVEGADAFIKKHLEQFYARLGLAPPVVGKGTLKQQLLSTAAPSKSVGKAPTPAEFYRQKGQTDGVSQILIFGKFIEQFRNRPQFTRKDINAVAKEAKVAKDVHTQYFTNAVRQGLLRKEGEKYSLTISAESLLGGGS